MNPDGDTHNPTKQEIMEATYQALSEHGYGNLTIQAIANEFDNSKSLLYYHYDGKDDLLVDFLDHALHQFLEEVRVQDRPAKRLRTLIDNLVPETLDDEPYRVQLAMFELRVNAPHDHRCRQQYLDVDRELKEFIRETIQQGVESGVFVAVDPAVEAERFLSLLTGVRTRRLTTYDEFSIKTARNALITEINHMKSDESIPSNFDSDTDSASVSSDSTEDTEDGTYYQ